ncbi:hypothetical protein FMEAI12_4010011 [Parafrankia sp. Ea1.12]|nr:hypothetical protein FMEAI12_4010011 [Parafrankia sp. Ea1.12]
MLRRASSRSSAQAIPDRTGASSLAAGVDQSSDVIVARTVIPASVRLTGASTASVDMTPSASLE